MSNKDIIYSAEGKLNTKLRRQADIKKRGKSLSLSEFSSYRTNTTKEELCLEYISNLSSQFKQAHPTRKYPFMIAENEYGVKKFLSTSLRASEMPFADLYDLHECATFFAGYIQFEPLDPPFEPPTSVFSPTQTLSSFVGDCFDISTLLCSFLLGVGYDAYVVNGYAPRHITLNDQSMTMCPMASGPKEIPQVLLMIPEENSSNTEENTNSSVPETSTYSILDNSIKESQYLKDQREAEIEAAKDTFQLWIQENQPAIPVSGRHTSEGRRKHKKEEAHSDKTNKLVHSWVMVLPGRRDIKEVQFIESSTGRVYTPSTCPYEGIESIWNQANYWMNLRPDKYLSDLSYDLLNARTWECVFVEASNVRTREGISQDTGNAHGHGKHNHDPNIYYVGTAAITISRAFDCPPSYVNLITLTRKDYLTKYPPNGKRSVKYFCSKADFFARGINSQCLTMRITQYLDIACTIVSEIHEWYENRKDKLFKRSRYFLNDVHTIEYFHPGSVGEIKCWQEYPGKRLLIDYYVDGNLERLKRRDEVIGESVTEYFDGRTDRLIKRVFNYTDDKNLVGSRTFFTLPANNLSQELYILSMQQVFEKQTCSELKFYNEDDVFTRHYFIPEGKLITKYHFKPGSIQNEIKTFFHTRVGLSNTATVINEISLLQEIGLDEDPEKLQEASSLERECSQSIRQAYQVLIDIINKRYSHEVNQLPDYSVYEQAVDRAHDQANASSTTNNNNNANSLLSVKATDYLTPFLRNVKDISKITREEALEVRQNCLDAMKMRLIERANIIQSRLNDENVKLGRKQEQFQRSQREGDFSTEEYEKYCTEAMFRIQILEKRLVDHEEASLKKFAELDSKLASDSRLRVLRL